MSTQNFGIAHGDTVVVENDPKLVSGLTLSHNRYVECRLERFSDTRDFAFVRSLADYDNHLPGAWVSFRLQIMDKTRIAEQ